MFIELIRLGKDAELKQAVQTEILSLYAAYDVGFGDKKKTQWISSIVAMMSVPLAIIPATCAARLPNIVRPIH